MAKKNTIRRFLAIAMALSLALSLMTVTAFARHDDDDRGGYNDRDDRDNNDDHNNGGFWPWPWPGGGNSTGNEWYEVYVQGDLVDSAQGEAGDVYWLGTHYTADYEITGTDLIWYINPQGVDSDGFTDTVDLTPYIGEIPEGFEIGEVKIESGSINGINDPYFDQYDNAVITITIKTIVNPITGEIIEIPDPVDPDPVDPDPVDPDPVDPPVNPYIPPYVPYYPPVIIPPVEIEEPEVPLAEEVEIVEEEVPLEEVPLEELPDEEVPLAEVPKTGSSLALFTAMTAVSGLGLAWVSLKKKSDEE